MLNNKNWAYVKRTLLEPFVVVGETERASLAVLSYWDVELKVEKAVVSVVRRGTDASVVVENVEVWLLTGVTDVELRRLVVWETETDELAVLNVWEAVANVDDGGALVVRGGTVAFVAVEDVEMWLVR